MHQRQWVSRYELLKAAVNKWVLRFFALNYGFRSEWRKDEELQIILLQYGISN